MKKLLLSLCFCLVSFTASTQNYENTIINIFIMKELADGSQRLYWEYSPYGRLDNANGIVPLRVPSNVSRIITRYYKVSAYYDQIAKTSSEPHLIVNFTYKNGRLETIEYSQELYRISYQSDGKIVSIKGYSELGNQICNVSVSHTSWGTFTSGRTTYTKEKDTFDYYITWWSSVKQRYRFDHRYAYFTEEYDSDRNRGRWIADAYCSFFGLSGIMKSLGKGEYINVVSSYAYDRDFTNEHRDFSNYIIDNITIYHRSVHPSNARSIVEFEYQY